MKTKTKDNKMNKLNVKYLNDAINEIKVWDHESGYSLADHAHLVVDDIELVLNASDWLVESLNPDGFIKLAEIVSNVQLKCALPNEVAKFSITSNMIKELKFFNRNQTFEDFIKNN
jgi:hypothetical protein